MKFELTENRKEHILKRQALEKHQNNAFPRLFCCKQ